MKKIVLSCAAASLLIASCKKEENGSNLSSNDMLTAGKWMMVGNMSYETTGSVTDTTNDFASYDNCEKDNLFFFKNDGHFIADEGATKCDTADAQQEDAGMWALIEQNSKLKLSDSSYSETYNINTLTSSKLEMEYADTVGSVVYRQVLTFSNAK